MSPFLFALAMEYFSRVLKKVKGRDINFHPKCAKTRIMKLLFADDLFIFTKPDIPSLVTLRKVIDDFAKVSGLHINSGKSAIYFAGVPVNDEACILDAIGVPKGSLPFRYLGFSLSSKRLGFCDCKSIVDRITARVTHWTSTKLSIAGRVQLVTSVIHGMHSYWAQVFVLPRRIISMVEQVCNAFIWSLDKQKGSKPRVAWKYVCMPRVFGGLNICNIQVWNDMALLKSLWALAYKKDRLWIRWVHDYYIKGADLLHYLIPSSTS